MCVIAVDVCRFLSRSDVVSIEIIAAATTTVTVTLAAAKTYLFTNVEEVVFLAVYACVCMYSVVQNGYDDLLGI